MDNKSKKPPSSKPGLILLSGIASLICCGAILGPIILVTKDPRTPSAVTSSFVLGYLFFIDMILGPLTWGVGNRALSAIGSGEVNQQEHRAAAAGRNCGIVATVLSWVSALGYLGYIGVELASFYGLNPL